MSSRSPLIPATPSAEEYQDSAGRPLDDIFAREDPITLFAEWLARAGESEPNDPNAVSVATVDADGMPDVRVVLLKDFGPDGFVFYSHKDGAKGSQITANPVAAMCFHWKSLRLQVRLRGAVSLIEGERADAYFATRARLSQIGAWASEQSRELESREVLRDEVALLDSEYGDEVPRPEGWVGFRLEPREIEFWRDRPFRLHDRLLFTRGQNDEKGWVKTRLYP